MMHQPPHGRPGPWGPQHSDDAPSGATSSGHAGPPGAHPGASAGWTPRGTATLAAHAPTLGWSPPRHLLGLSLLNALLWVATLGCYGFWGKTEVRRRLWSAIRIDGEPLEYTGEGRELFVGFLIVFAVVLLPAILLGVATTLFADQRTHGTVQALLYAGFALLYGIGAYRAQRYRLSRTRWRGIRMRLGGSAMAYGWTYLWTLALMPLTLGWIAPWRATRLQALLVRNMAFGDRPLSFTAASGPLYASFAALWVGAAVILVCALGIIGREVATVVHDGGDLRHLPQAARTRLGLIVVATLAVGSLLFGIAAAWYRARTINHFARHTRIGDARFKGTASTLGLIWLAVSNKLIVLGSVGILAPIAQARATRYLVRNLSLEGAIDLDGIGQAPPEAATRGEGLAQAFDVDAF